jgi:hypothetical protein
MAPRPRSPGPYVGLRKHRDGAGGSGDRLERRYRPLRVGGQSGAVPDVLGAAMTLGVNEEVYFGLESPTEGVAKIADRWGAGQ